MSVVHLGNLEHGLTGSSHVLFGKRMTSALQIKLRATDAISTPAGRIVEAARLSGDSGVGRTRPRHYAYRAMVLLVRGGGSYRDTEGVERTVVQGDLIFVEPRIGHSYGPGVDQKWDEFYVSYEGPVFDAMAAAGAPGAARPVLRLREAESWQKRLEKAFPERGTVEAAGQIGALVELILAAHAGADPATTATAREPKWLGRARQLLAAPADAPDLAAVARACGLSAESFRKQFASRTGESPGRYRLLSRIEQAKRLLRDHDAPHRVVAKATGFCDEFHFSKIFKRVTGLSPSAWREGAARSEGTQVRAKRPEK